MKGVIRMLLSAFSARGRSFEEASEAMATARERQALSSLYVTATSRQAVMGSARTIEAAKAAARIVAGDKR